MLHWKSGISRPADFGNPAGPRKIDPVISYTNHLTLLMENFGKRKRMCKPFSLCIIHCNHNYIDCKQQKKSESR